MTYCTCQNRWLICLHGNIVSTTIFLLNVEYHLNFYVIIVYFFSSWVCYSILDVIHYLWVTQILLGNNVEFIFIVNSSISICWINFKNDCFKFLFLT